MTDRCIFCGATELLNRRRIGEGGVEVDVCDRCSDVGQQAQAIVRTLRPYLPLVERLAKGALGAIFKTPTR